MTDSVENAQERRPKTPLECRDWIGERMENALRIAMSKEGEDRAGWLEDAHYFSSVLSILIKEVNAAPPATQTAGMVPPLDDEVRAILGTMCFAVGGIAETLRKGGYVIKHKAEDEQAVVAHWSLSLYAKHGKEWRAKVEEELKAMLAAGKEG